ncbi:E3 ubiquitin-protein ligase rnf8-like [Metopolophium dirhodum]|uniref:E3 ubiquitin-protein ligase rnf8-like n=1 Tax=Metopolophium dirhodum TaxID=44670 RepID=UPI00298F736C|nr:E3 ubiquitin-protein ligase rnf8-like [Metopolophium dirhodum]
MNPICKFCLHGSCRSSKKCVNRHEKLSLKLDDDDDEYPLLDFGAAGTTHKQVQQTTTIESTIEPITAVVHDEKYLFPNKLKKTKSIKKQLEHDLKELRNENAKLNRTIVALGTSTSTLTEQLKEEKNKNAKLTEEFNIALLGNDDCQCCICCEVFIRPSLLSCSHMFCEWCIDKWLEKYNHCPTCRVLVTNYTHCLNMNNFIQRKMELMPAETRLAFKALEVARAKDKQTSVQIQAERRRLEFIAMTLNEHRPS